MSPAAALVQVDRQVELAGDVAATVQVELPVKIDLRSNRGVPQIVPVAVGDPVLEAAADAIEIDVLQQGIAVDVVAFAELIPFFAKVFRIAARCRCLS